MNPYVRKLRTAAYVVFFLLAAGIAGLQLRERYRSPSLPEFGSVPEFSLLTESKSSFSNRNFHGKITIADFVFTSCAGPCPLMSAEMRRLQAELGDRPLAQFVSFSVDPETDTPEVLEEYANRFGAIRGKWIFLTGEKKGIYNLTRDGFHLAIEADSEAIAHSTKFVLIDAEAKIRGYYDSEDSESVRKLASDAERLME